MPKISSAKNESCCRGPWQKIDYFVKYSPVETVHEHHDFPLKLQQIHGSRQYERSGQVQ